ncbi:sigma-70 family RNA polymerase sigma factor [Bittarella massiliensis]|uniref:RNA polymerase sigma factor n=1 Tax=Bittarella massiliensis (ex Durand et al. 2017) TaxID=1720313 RepID=UPI00163BF5A2|nr:sigma-70 family RNA polymerase sigma factor [Bittarella massiliensis (ex Durand et al. 2017)]MBC2870162.1 sigma-70 family RNA polymerase sigma factor [Bittarella massiliensis (ex Durand et al. 2017)]
MEEKRMGHRQLEQLLLRAREGDEQAFAQLYRATCRAQWVQARALLGSDALAEEAVQESYLSLFRHMGELGNPRALVAYLNRSTYFACQNLRRVEARRAATGEELLDALPDGDPRTLPEAVADQRGRTAALLAALDKLPQRQRQAVVLRYFQRQTLPQIAAVLGCSEMTVKRELDRAKKALRGNLSGWLPAVLPLGIALRRAGEQPAPWQLGEVPLPVAGVAAGLVLAVTAGIALLPTPQILETAVWQAGGRAGVTARVAGAETAWLEDGDGNRYALERGEDGFSLLPVKNGSYTLQAEGGNGRRVQTAVSVTGADEEPPTLAEAYGQAGLVTVRLTDPAGVDWERSFLLGADGALYRPLEAEGERARFDLPSGSYTLVAQDLLGNRGRGELTVSQ